MFSWGLPITQVQAWPMFSFDNGTGPAIYGFVSYSASSNGIARWNGAEWVILGTPTWYDGGPPVFAAYDYGRGPQLHAGSSFTTMGNVFALRIARWSGQRWESLGTSSANDPVLVRAMCVYDDGTGPALYVSGDREYPSQGLFYNGIARWNGQSWSDVGGGVNGPPNSPVGVRAMAVFDDGSGPALYVAGAFSSAGGVPARGIARWNGSQWSALGNGIGAYQEQLIPFQDERGPSLFVAGTFINVGGGQSPSLAQWVGCPSCYPDCENDHRLDVRDFVCFLQKYAGRDPYANCTVDAAIDVNDFVCFAQKFAAGCGR